MHERYLQGRKAENICVLLMEEYSLVDMCCAYTEIVVSRYLCFSLLMGIPFKQKP